MKIVDKLRLLFASLLREQHSIMYALVESRKLLEARGMKEPFKELVFYCDWVVHSELRGDYAQKIVRLFDQYQQLHAALDAGDSPDFQFLKELDEVVSMSRFREELREFLLEFGLPTRIVDVDVLWTEFLTGYLLIVAECPLRCLSQGLKYIDAVTLTIVDIKSICEADSIGQPRIHIDWTWKAVGSGDEGHMVRYYN